MAQWICSARPTFTNDTCSLRYTPVDLSDRDVVANKFACQKCGSPLLRVGDCAAAVDSHLIETSAQSELSIHVGHICDAADPIDRKRVAEWVDSRIAAMTMDADVISEELPEPYTDRADGAISSIRRCIRELHAFTSAIREDGACAAANWPKSVTDDGIPMTAAGLARELDHVKRQRDLAVHNLDLLTAKVFDHTLKQDSTDLETTKSLDRAMDRAEKLEAVAVAARLLRKAIRGVRFNDRVTTTRPTAECWLALDEALDAAEVR